MKIKIAGTGHRPSKLGTDKLSGYAPQIEEIGLIAISYHLDPRLAANEIEEIWSGVALGLDTWIAKWAIQHGIPLVCKVPFVGQEKMWPESSQRQYQRILNQAARVDIVSEGGYSPAKMQIRNLELCKADMMLALWNGTSGGTANCVKAANKLGVPVENIWDTFEQLRQQL